MKATTSLYAEASLTRMLPALLLTVSTAGLLGCAGVQSDFECNATAGDSCMTMEDANNKAREMAGAAEVKPVAASLPPLVDLPQRGDSLSGGTPARSVLVAPVTKPGGFLTPLPVSPSPARSDLSRNASVSPVKIHQAIRLCADSQCNDDGEVRAMRASEVTASVWIAPWVDTNDALHQPGRVTFVVTDPHWQLPAVME